MLRSFVCALVALALFASAGFTDDKAAGKAKVKPVVGKLKSVDAEKGTLTISTGKKGEEKDMEFKLTADTKITVFNGDDKQTLSGKAALKDPSFKTGTRVAVLSDDGKVTEVRVGTPPKKKNNK